MSPSLADCTVLNEVSTQHQSASVRNHSVRLKYYSHAVGILDRRQSMRNCKRRPTLRCPVQSFLHNFLRVRIECRGGLIQKQHPRIP